MKKEFKNILVIRTDRIGDVVLTTPSLKVLREAYPKARISLLAVEATRALVECNPYLDEIIYDNRNKKHRGLGGFLKLCALLKSKKYDLAIVFHTKKRTNLLCFLAQIPYRIGYKNNKFGFLLTHPIKDTRHQGDKHEVYYCLDLLKHLGVEYGSFEFNICVKEESEIWVKEYLANNNVSLNDRLIAIHPGASDPSRRWPPYFFAEVINKLMSQHPYKVVIIGATDIEGVAQKITSLTTHPIIDAIGQTNMSQLISLLKRSQLLISNDSGPVHIAEGVKTPVISIFTRNQPGINPGRWGPLSNRSRAISVPEDTTISFAKARDIDPKYLELIKPQQVLEAVDAIFKLC